MELPSTRREDTQKGVEEALKADETRRNNRGLIAGLILGVIIASVVWWRGGETGWVVASFVFGLTVGFNAGKK